MVDGNYYIQENEEKVNFINNFFLSHNNLDTSNAVLPPEIPAQNEGISHIEATEDDIEDLIKALDSNKATGPDGVSPKLIKEAGKSLVPSLTKLINLSLRTSLVPSQWKKANVLPLFKKGSKSDVNNYRPVSILPAPSKILEKIVLKKVYNYFRDHNVLTKHQSGF